MNSYDRVVIAFQFRQTQHEGSIKHVESKQNCSRVCTFHYKQFLFPIIVQRCLFIHRGGIYIIEKSVFCFHFVETYSICTLIMQRGSPFTLHISGLIALHSGENKTIFDIIRKGSREAESFTRLSLTPETDAESDTVDRNIEANRHAICRLDKIKLQQRNGKLVYFSPEAIC